MLEVKDLHAYYGKSHILHGVHLDVGQGEIVSLLGRNGVGRSTTIKAIMGQVASTGSVRFKNSDIQGLKTFVIARKGLGYVPESRDIFPSLTVQQNLQLGMKGTRSEGRWKIDDMYGMFPQLKDRRDAPAGVMSGGEQQMLTLCRTLMGDPDLVMIDEPTEGLAPKIVEQVARLFEEIKNRGVSILLVEQKAPLALKMASRAYVLANGRIAAEVNPREIKSHDELARYYFA
ncbi:MAG: ABC transporter ATP-binding protein [Burkholderiales bacterium]